jgi:hypothetical protein
MCDVHLEWHENHDFISNLANLKYNFISFSFWPILFHCQSLLQSHFSFTACISTSFLTVYIKMIISSKVNEILTEFVHVLHIHMTNIIQYLSSNFWVWKDGTQQSLVYGLHFFSQTLALPVDKCFRLVQQSEIQPANRIYYHRYSSNIFQWRIAGNLLICLIACNVRHTPHLDTKICDMFMKRFNWQFTLNCKVLHIYLSIYLLIYDIFNDPAVAQII